MNKNGKKPFKHCLYAFLPALIFLVLALPAAGGGLVINDSPAPAQDKEPRLVVEKRVNAIFANAGDTVVYFITLANNGNLSAYNTVMSDTLPEPFVFSESQSASRTWQLGDLAPGETRTFSLAVDISPEAEPGYYRNLVLVQADNHGPVSATAEIEVREVVVGAIEFEEKLVKTGFSRTEALAVLVLVGSFLALAWYLRRESNA